MSAEWVMLNGEHKDKPITRVPVHYLRWMVNVRHTHAERAEAELKRRGTTIPDLEVSGHAVDRASLMCRWAWHEFGKKDEGLHSWLVRSAREAIENGEAHPTDAGRFEWNGLSYRFEMDVEWPVLKTVLPGKSRRCVWCGRRRALAEMVKEDGAWHCKGRPDDGEELP